MSTVRLELPASARYLVLARLAVTGLCRTAGADEEATADLKLAVTEAVGNAVRHAYSADGGRVELLLEQRDGAIRVSVRDDGTGFDPTMPRNGGPELQEESGPGEGGMGLKLIRSIAPDLVVDTAQGRGTTLSFSVPLARVD